MRRLLTLLGLARFLPKPRPLHRVHCPVCHEEEFYFRVTETGKGETDFGTCHWWSGQGRCRACGVSGHYSDSSL